MPTTHVEWYEVHRIQHHVPIKLSHMHRLFRMCPQVSGKVIRPTERLVTALKFTNKRTFLRMDQHVPLQVLKPLKTPVAGRELARMLVGG